MSAFEKYLRYFRAVIVVLTICIFTIITTAFAQTANAPGVSFSGLQLMMTIATGITLPLLLLLFALYRKLSDQIGPIMEAVDSLKLWKEQEVNPAIHTIDTRDSKSRHDLRNEVHSDIMVLDERLQKAIENNGARIMFLERQLMNGKT